MKFFVLSLFSMSMVVCSQYSQAADRLERIIVEGKGESVIRKGEPNNLRLIKQLAISDAIQDALIKCEIAGGELKTSILDTKIRGHKVTKNIEIVEEGDYVIFKATLNANCDKELK